MRIHLSLVALAACAMSFGQALDTLQAAPGSLTTLNTTVSAQAATIVYDNTAGGLFTSSVRPALVLDDAVLSAGQTKCNLINIGFNVSAGANANVDMDIFFYDTVNYAGGPLNSVFINSFTVSFGSLAAGSYQSGLIDFSGLFTVVVPDGNLGVVAQFRDGNALSARATVLFAQGPPGIGSSQDAYARDVNGNGIFDAGEARTFGGAPNLANFYMQLGYVPEPGTYAAMATGVIGLLGLRRRRK